jgi:hypothetical protein
MTEQHPEVLPQLLLYPVLTVSPDCRTWHRGPLVVLCISSSGSLSELYLMFQLLRQPLLGLVFRACSTASWPSEAPLVPVAGSSARRDQRLAAELLSLGLCAMLL